MLLKLMTSSLWCILFCEYIIRCSCINIQHTFSNNLSALLKQAKQNNNIIYGNPLHTQQCKTALLHEHKHNINLLNKKGFPTPWFWSRESLDATIHEFTLHRRSKITHLLEPNPPFIAPWSNTISNQYSTDHKNMSRHITKWYLENSKGNITNIGNQYKDDYISQHLHKKQSINNNVFYYHIEKSGSSSIAAILRTFGFSQTFVSENWISSTKCGFTFVRDPIKRFISGYYTVNRLIYQRNIPGKFIITYPHPYKYKWYNITSEPERFTQFVDDLMEFEFEFVNETPLEHLMSQTSILSVTQGDIHFIGRLKQLKLHWNELRKFCNNSNIKQFPDEDYNWMKNFGVDKFNKTEYFEYVKMMDLLSWESDDILPPYIAIANSYDLYYKIVNYYKQDYICFGFEHNFAAFRRYVHQKLYIENKRSFRNFTIT
eukprot:281218_1